MALISILTLILTTHFINNSTLFIAFSNLYLKEKRGLVIIGYIVLAG